jgi:hypothetical protein
VRGAGFRDRTLAASAGSTYSPFREYGYRTDHPKVAGAVVWYTAPVAFAVKMPSDALANVIGAMACGGPDAGSNLEWKTIRDARIKQARVDVN